MGRRAVPRAVGSALLSIALAACASDGPPAASPAEYREALAGICAGTSASLDALERPTGDAGVGEFSSAVATMLRAEADAARGLDVPDELDDAHRSFIRTTDEQAARWEELGATPSSDAAFTELTRRIGELTLGRNDLVAELGVDACARATA